ncbi:MAG: hypothetical protein C0397_19500 [Odoribacter sp.]|nr:hypothetical protein [Odoribacter sp.]
MSVEREKYMSREETKQLRTVTQAQATIDLSKGRAKGVVGWMLIDVALSTGLRVSEIARIKIEDVDFKRGSLRVVRSKKKHTKPETLALGKDLLQHLRDFISWTGKKDGSLFVGQRGALTPAGLQQAWKAAIKQANLPDELSIHSARHTCAVRLLKKTGNLRQVQKQLGHASPTITANMYADVSFEDMQNGVSNLFDD